MKRQSPEYALHATVADYLTCRFPEGCEVWWSTIGHGGGGKVRGARLKRIGVKKGVFDVMLLHERDNFIHRYDCYFLELKSKRGYPTPEQKAFMKRFGVRAQVAYMLEEVVEILDNIWRLPNPGGIKVMVVK